MSNGRHPSLPLDAQILTSVPQQVVEVRNRDRLTLPRHVVTDLPWLESSGNPLEALGILDTPGRICLASWDKAAPILDRRKALIERARADMEAAEALRVLEDRYRRIGIQADFRIVLTVDLLLHLEPMSAEVKHVYVARTADVVQILSPAYRNARLAEFQGSVSDPL